MVGFDSAANGPGQPALAVEASAILRFGSFELQGERGELRQHGDLVRLAPQPLKVLEILARRSGEVVTRHEIREHVWCGDTFVRSRGPMFTSGTLTISVVQRQRRPKWPCPFGTSSE